MPKPQHSVLVTVACYAALIACSPQAKRVESASQMDSTQYRLSQTAEILLTSEAGDKIARKENVPFVDGTPSGTRVVVQPDLVKQTMAGVGSSFTESSAFVLAHLDAEARLTVMEKIYGESGANFTLPHRSGCGLHR